MYASILASLVIVLLIVACFTVLAELVYTLILRERRRRLARARLERLVVQPAPVAGRWRVVERDPWGTPLCDLEFPGTDGRTCGTYAEAVQLAERWRTFTAGRGLAYTVELVG